MKKLVGICGLLFSVAQLYAAHAVPHAIMQLQKTTPAPWTITPAMISEKGTFYRNADINNPMKPGDVVTLESENSVSLGWQYEISDDFNVAYTLSAVMDAVTNTHHVAYSSPACTFIITAPHAADPDVRVINYNHANCQYQDNGQGGIFTMDTADHQVL